MYKYTIEYQYGQYTGTEEIFLEDHGQEEVAIAQMWLKFKRQGLLTLSLASRSADVISVTQEGE